jgi:uncharacterized protein (TIGR02145 family)
MNFRLTYLLLCFIFVSLHSCTPERKGEKVTDIDGNVYYTTTIGTQVWMRSNLKAVRLNDGTSITFAPSAWAVNTPVYCNIKNDDRNTNPFGKLYNYHVVATGKVCPEGWHVSTLADWNVLIDHLGGKDVAGGKLKEKGTVNWNIPNTRATNETLFSAVPAGYRTLLTSNTTSFFGFHADAYIWAASEATSESSAFAVVMSSTSGGIVTSGYDKRLGMSIRCIKDTPGN